MSDNSQSRRYEDNYAVLEQITESLNKDEIGIDDLVEKTREALGAARTCMEILNKQKGEFKKLETEFSQLLKSSPESESQEPIQEDFDEVTNAANIGEDDPF
jgi:exodeoxyribonuclease VII small subunit